jgi:excisionase family DNA binding protein
MYLSVQLAARRLGVSPHTIRRWTASGLLPCTRTAGGHRRIKQEDIDEIAVLVGHSDHLTARLAREREIETLVETSIALSSRLDLTELLAEIARRTTAILDCHFCAISDYDEQSGTMRVLADFDRHGHSVADWQPYSLNDFPFTKRLMEEQELAVVNIDDPHADPAETAIMRHYGDKSLLLIPLVHRDRSVGLLEVLDRVRQRRFTRQELRLARALAGLAAVALRNAEAFGRLSRGDHDAARLQTALSRVLDGLPAVAAAATSDEALREAAVLACRALPALSAAVTCGGAAAKASGAAAQAAGEVPAGTLQGEAHVIDAAAVTTRGTLSVTVTVNPAAGDLHATLVRLIAMTAGQAIDRLP